MKKTIGNVLSYGLIGLLLLYLAISFFFPQQSIDIFGFRTFVILSSSMEPDINKHDMIIVTKPHEETLEVGDAITFLVHIPELGAKSYVTHYIGDIIENNDGTTIYKTQGATKEPGDYDEWTDGNGQDYDITFDDIEGQYLFRLPYIGYVINGLRDPIFVGLLLINGIIIYYIITLLKPRKKEEEPDDKQKEIE